MSLETITPEKKPSDIWETGYSICLELIKTAETIKTPVIAGELSSTGFALLYEISRGKTKTLKPYIKKIKTLHRIASKTTTLLMLLHDLGHLNTDRYLTLNRDVNEFLAKLLKMINYAERKSKKENR